MNHKNDPLTIDISLGGVTEKTDHPDNATHSAEHHQSLADSTSTGYVVKKITGSTRFKNGLPDTKTGMHAVSIDTDLFGTASSVDDAAKQEAASIDTDVFVRSHHVNNHGYPVIVDESDVYQEQVVEKKPAPVERRENIKSPPSISVDISLEVGGNVLPSVERQEQLGSGIATGVLGAGGMAKVYKVWNEKLEVNRAVKVLLPTNQKEQLERFLTEAKITAKLHHHNIVETYDCGEWRGLPIIEMELIDGHTLATLVGAHGVMPVPVSVAVVLQVAEALRYAHAQELLIYGKKYKGIIHRDLKPSNVMVTPLGRVVLMDFGVARPMETGLHTVVTDSIVGTIHYFSPEQIGGYPIDHLTDVYSFGAVLYELLCGKNPFPYSNMISMIQAKTKNQFVRLEEYPIAIDRRVASVAQTCLRTDKRERYADFAEVIAVLTEILQSYRMGSAEEIVGAFLRNPGKVRMECEHFYQNFTTREVAIGPEVQKSSTVSSKSEPDTVNRESTEWEPRKRPLLRTIVISAILLLVLIMGCVLLMGKADVHSKDESLSEKAHHLKLVMCEVVDTFR